MKSTVLSITILVVCTLTIFNSSGQSNLSVSVPVIWSEVKVKDNWTPPTAPNYKEYHSGSAVGYGINLYYSFQPKLLTKDKHFFMNIGAGYFKQRFNVTRPFDYNSPVQPIFRTDHYSYHCWQGLIGLSYNYQLKKDYFLMGTLTYNALYSFRQDYVPTFTAETQVNHEKINFGKIVSLNVGLNKYLGERFWLGLHVVAPLYTRWRNDKIFRDDPTTYYHPKFGLGTYLSVSYRISKNSQP
ncbi:MAG: hypothetical protein KF725_17375 [Cyclobacteriaceae bacterium]|nr:hypothetical protein [Cyclobacteriaceae bacterium]MBX3009811.1 hypothetical protein [Melioribacteraceae bacterium]UYN85254.1 MAG: hypothetical protein KIT51_10125 [Cyclobacteriaceae bacterium]